jgi:hypothetical protein
VRRAVLLLALLGGCDRCASCKDSVKAHLTEPPIEDQRKEVERQIKTASRQATSMCGFPVKGLADAKVTIESESPRRFLVEGKPIAQNEAGADKSKAALCVAVVSIFSSAQVDENNVVTGFKYRSFEVESVSTPGVQFTKPSSGGWD